MTRASTRTIRALLPALVAWLAAAPAHAQVYSFANGHTGAVVGTVGSAEIVETAGPPLYGRREIFRPVPPLRLQSRWLVVQDELAGAVFAAPGGAVAGTDRLVGDFSIRAIEGMLALEVRSVAFDVWGEPIGLFSATEMDDHAAGERWTMSPEWEEMPRAATYRSSVSWIHRVMFEDESVLEADSEVVRAAWEAATDLPFDRLAGLELRAVPGR